MPDANLDPLTNICNRQRFEALLKAALLTSSREWPLSLLHLDLDDFKRVNDEYGHMVGDHVLRHVAGLLPTEGGVVPGRTGGDEFKLIVPGLDETASLLYADRICEIISTHPAMYEGREIVVTGSIGVSTTEWPVQAADIREQETSALYTAKRAGRNRAVHFRAIEREALRLGEDVRVHTFEVMQRVVSERAEKFIAHRRHQLLEYLQNRADRDGLTGLFNRGYMDRRIAHTFQEARNSSRPLCVALIDVDHFGAINKTLGWPTGDLTLRGIADLVRQNVRGGDWVARYGGEEIAVILPDVGQETAAQVAERVRGAVAGHPFRDSDGKSFSVTVTVGVVELQPGEALPELWQRLSKKLIGAKDAGRNRVAF